MIDVDLSALDVLAVDIGRASAQGVAAARPVVKKAAQNVKDETVDEIPDRYWGKLKPTVSYDIVGLDAEVGYEDRGQGELAGIYEFGSARRDPHPTLYPAADREAPRFEKAMSDAIDKAVGGIL